MLKAALERAEYLASTDTLTGLFNRRVLFERLDQEMARSRREEMCILFNELVCAVDHALYAAKHHGRNCVICSSAGIPAPVS